MERIKPYRPLLLLCAYAAARYHIAFTLDSPVFGWRPADMASIALGYARHGFHFLYPQVFWGGSGPGYVEMELPLTPFLTAILFKVFGFHEWLSLVWPLLCGLGIVLTTERLGTRLAGGAQGVGLVAGLVAAVTPPLIMLTSTGMWADLPEVLMVNVALLLGLRWLERGRSLDLALAAASLSLAILCKLTALYAGIPFLYLFIRKYGASWWRTGLTWLTGIAVLLPPLLWYLHAYHLAVTYGNTFGILAGGYSKFGNTTLLTGSAFYQWLGRRLLLYHFTPIGVVGAAVGLVLALRRRVDPVLLSWVASVALYVPVAATGIHFGHYHYLLPILPVGSILAGIGLVWLLKGLLQALGQMNIKWLRTAVVAAAVGLFGLNAAWAERRFETRDRAQDSVVWAQKKTTGLLVKQLTRADALLIVVDTQMDAVTPQTSMSPPDVFYFGDRRGWYISLAWLTEAGIERLRAQGAQYLVVSGQSVDDFRTRHAELVQSLVRRYPPVLYDERGIILDLGEPFRSKSSP
jgi:4-amino-4-deoxy-L-arabinose transferase-like glycosyltransferase